MVLHVVTSHHVWLYIKCVVIHIYLYTPAFHSTIYVIMHNGAWLYVYFYIKSVDIHRTPALTLHHMVTRMVIPLHVWLYIKHTFIYTLTFHCTACGYTSRYTVILVISRIYTYVIVPYIFQHRPLCLLLKVR